jgi:hypothetical protein
MSYALSDSNGDDQAAKRKSQPDPQELDFDARGCSATYLDDTKGTA